MTESVTPVIRRVGQNVAFETAIRVGLSMAARLLLGYLSGLPPTAISVNAAVAFFLTAVLEVPTGMVADIYGKFVSVRLGYACQFLACLSIFGAIAVYPASPAAMWALIVVEGVLDALGNCFLSGAREAAFQSIMEARTREMAPSDRAALLRRYLSLADAHGRLVLALFPLVVLATVLVLHRVGGGHYGMLLIAAGWVAIDRQFRGLAKHAVDSRAATAQTLGAWSTAASESWRGLVASAGLRAVVACCFVNRFIFITVSCYASLAVLKDGALWPAGTPIFPVLCMTALLLVGRLARSMVLPKLADRFSNESTMLLGATLQCVLSGIMLRSSQMTGVSAIFYLSLTIGVYDVIVGMIERPAMGLILSEVPDGIRATFLSGVSAMVFLAQAVYSVRLTLTGIGTPGMSEIWSLVLIGGIFMAALMSARILRLARQAQVVSAE